MNQQQRYKYARKVTVIGAVVNAFLGIIKIIGGLLFHSHALIADGVHSFSDLFTDLMVLIASKYGSQEADHSHPYGHQRFETAATLLLALFLILAGAGIAWDAFYEILYEHADAPGFLALPIALISIIANEMLYHYTHYIGKYIESTLIIANAWHHRSDAASSVVVTIGLIGSLSGYLYLDAIAAMIVAFMIIKMGWSYGWDSVKELVDTAVEPKKLSRIKDIIQHVDGIQRIHQLRSRSMGGDVYVDVHILVSPYISVSEGHYIAQHVHHLLVDKMKEVKDVTVHVDPEDDELVCPSLHLPNRKKLETMLLQKWRTAFPEINAWLLHYLEGNIQIDLICNQSFDIQALCEQIQKDLMDKPFVTRVRILLKADEVT